MIEITTMSQERAQALIDAHDHLLLWCAPLYPMRAFEDGLMLLLSGETPSACSCTGLCGHRVARLIQCQDARSARDVADDRLLGLLHRKAVSAAGAAVEQTVQLIERATRELLQPNRPSQTLPAWGRPALAA